MFSPTFTSSQLKQYDRMTFTQFFRDRLSHDGFELVGHATGMIHYEGDYLLGGLIDFFAWYRAEQYQLVGGMETLVKAFEQRLPGNVQYNAKRRSPSGVFAKSRHFPRLARSCQLRSSLQKSMEISGRSKTKSTISRTISRGQGRSAKR